MEARLFAHRCGSATSSTIKVMLPLRFLRDNDSFNDSEQIEER